MEKENKVITLFIFAVAIVSAIVGVIKETYLVIIPMFMCLVALSLIAFDEKDKKPEKLATSKDQNSE